MSSVRLTGLVALTLLVAYGVFGCTGIPTPTPVPTMARSAPTPRAQSAASPSRTPAEAQAQVPSPATTEWPTPTTAAAQPEASRAPRRVHLTPAAELGKGVVRDMAVSPDGETVAVAAARGVFFYAASDLTERAHLSTPAAATRVAYRADGAAIVVGLADGRLGVWSIPEHREVGLMPAHSGPIYQVDYAPSGDLVASLGADGALYLWAPGSEPLSLSIRGQTRFLFSPDGRYVAAGGGKWNREIILFEVATGRELTRSEVLPDLSGMAFGPDGGLLAVSGAGGEVLVIETATGLSRKLDGPPVVRGLAFHPDGRWLAVGAFGAPALVLDVRNGETVATLQVSEQGIYPAFSGDGRRLALVDAQGFRVWEVDAWQLVAQAEAYAAGPLAFGTGGESLLGRRGSTIASLDLASGTTHLALGHMDLTASLAFAPDGSLLAVGDWQGLIHLLDLESGRARAILAGHRGPVGSLSFSPDGTRLASAGVNEDTAGALWDVHSGERLADLQGDPGYPLRPLIFDPSGNLLVGSGNPDVIVLDTQTGRERRLSGHTDGTVSLAISPDGSLLASGAFDERVIVWDYAAARPLYELPEHGMGAVSLEFAPGDSLGLEGYFLVSGDQRGRVRIWAADDGTLLQTIEARGNDLARSPDGGLLAFKTTLDDITLWDVSAAAEVDRVQALASRPLAFAPDGRHIASGSPEGVITLWRLTSE